MSRGAVRLVWKESDHPSHIIPPLFSLVPQIRRSREGGRTRFVSRCRQRERSGCGPYRALAPHGHRLAVVKPPDDLAHVFVGLVAERVTHAAEQLSHGAGVRIVHAVQQLITTTPALFSELGSGAGVRTRKVEKTLRVSALPHRLQSPFASELIDRKKMRRNN